MVGGLVSLLLVLLWYASLDTDSHQSIHHLSMYFHYFPIAAFAGMFGEEYHTMAAARVFDCLMVLASAFEGLLLGALVDFLVHGRQSHSHGLPPR